ncbi:heat-inducible transcriptional repressor HrcA [Coriobacteriia bacterium Es71-Z0120]|uniref:heat-inducible transcriptional repressor HrcA n=1 Tax=Parvivirga hydrogeniphila TaxID=2939460 RepID=UPI0022609775|nr:heat-inducible transcriptional repressor HrcA [Parvivirga hydrogeniphila]MCL4078988.1 heat-inducible transcriptional repressor HrcA [Parvivirga hydrogeniphila]
MLSERRRAVLAALVEEYVATMQPVASKALVERHHLGCSPATVRAELAALEESGHVAQPHVSAGRVPTDRGYRAFVDDVRERIDALSLSATEVERIHRMYETLEMEMDEVLRETSMLLSRFTNYVAIVAAPALRRARLRRISIVPMAERRALVVVVTDSGQVANRMLELAEPVAESVLSEVERYLTAVLEDKIGEQVIDVREGVRAGSDVFARTTIEVLDAVADCLREADDDRVVTGGVAALLSQPEFADPHVARPVVELLEDGITMLRLLTEAMRETDVTVRIGHENPIEALGSVSVVLSPYGRRGAMGIVGVIGPTRMDYPRAIGTVRTVADTLTDILG